MRFQLPMFHAEMNLFPYIYTYLPITASICWNFSDQQGIIQIYSIAPWHKLFSRTLDPKLSNFPLKNSVFIRIDLSRDFSENKRKMVT